MKAILMILFLSIGLIVNNQDASMSGIKIGSSVEELDQLKLKILAEDNSVENSVIKKFRTDNGNHFSVTAINSKVVFMENDWLGQPAGIKPLITDFKFGITTLQEIRQTFGSNGFAYVKYPGTTTEKDIIMLNCYEIDSPNDEVLVVITKLPIHIARTYDDGNFIDHLKLEALILSDSDYLDAIWGKEKMYDSGNKKIKL